MIKKIYKSIVSQINQIEAGGWLVAKRKIRRFIVVVIKIPHRLSAFILVFPVVIAIRIITPFIVVRIGRLNSYRIGHFAAYTESYLCEVDAGIHVPDRRYLDLFYIPYRSISNNQLAKMWRRVLRIWPAWIMAPILHVNRLLPNSSDYEIKESTPDFQYLFERYPPHIEFTKEEEVLGEEKLKLMGIPQGSKFVCLLVRDSAYLNSGHNAGNDWSYHDFRDSDISDYVAAAEELADRGYFVIRMGVTVHKRLKASHPRIIDYATNGMRDDFMDIYLGAKCEFCISTCAGWDAIPIIFRRPIVFVNLVTLAQLVIFRIPYYFIPKRLYSEPNDRELTLREVFSSGASSYGYSQDYINNEITLINNTSEEIRDIVVEVEERLRGAWHTSDDDDLQRKFWNIVPTSMNNDDGNPFYGQIRGKIGSLYLRNNPEYLR